MRVGDRKMEERRGSYIEGKCVVQRESFASKYY